MLTTSLRSLTESEKQVLTQKLPSRYQQWEERILIFVFSVALLLVPILIFDHFLPAPPAFQAAYCMAAAAGAVLITGRLSAKKKALLQAAFPVESCLVEVIQVQTSRAVKREDPEDFGVAYYLPVLVGNEPQTLYLRGQYLDELEYEGLFPNTAFSFSRLPGSPEFLTFGVLGQYFEPERSVPAFTKAVWESNLFPVNGQLLPEPLDSIA
jgi:hypothetical protein